MKKLLFLFYLFLFGKLCAQESVTASGGNASGAGGSASYSVGQIAYSNHAGSGGSLNEGVQQPFEIFLLSNDSFENSNNISLYPNPTPNQLFLNLKELEDGFRYTLVNASGKTLLTDKIIQLNTVLNLENLAQGIYILSITSEKKSNQKSYKIIKNN